MTKQEATELALEALSLICLHSSRHCELLDRAKSGLYMNMDDCAELAGYEKACRALANLTKSDAEGA